jgi:hypothetical protein
VWLGIIIAGLLATSLPHSLRFIEYIAVGDFRRSDPMIEYMKQDKQLFRALPITGSSFYNRNYLPIFGIETANGFYDNRIRYYESLSQKDFANLFHPSIMRIANIKYVITTQKVEHTLLALERSFGNAFLYRNTGFLPRALIVHHAVVAESDSAALEVIKQPDFDPATTIVLHSGEPLRSEVPEAEEWARIRRPDLNKIIVDARVASPGYLFYSANYLPFWKAYVDGREVPVLRCNLSMRAIYLDPGEHTVEMKYSSPWFMAGSYVCLLSCLFVTLALVMDFRSRRKRGSRG